MKYSELTLEEAVIEFLLLLDKREESDSGNVFSPNQISSCRVMDGLKMGKLLDRMKDATRNSQ